MDQRIGYLIKRAQAALRARMDAALQSKGITTLQYSVLSTLEAEPGSSNAELARHTFVTPQTMMRIVDNLQAAGLIERVPHATHGKVLTSTLTHKGKAVVASCHAKIAAVEERMLRQLDRPAREALQASLLGCVQALSEE